MKRRLTIVAAAAVAIAAAAVVLTLGGGSAKPDRADPTTAGGTGTVARRTLAERVTVEGKIGYAGESAVLARLSGTVTELPAVGDVVRRGQELYGIGGEPVILMYGKVPAYRDLGEGVAEGPDVEQLESNLEALGYDPGTVDDEFTAATAAAVAAWQEDLGLKATGEVELGKVSFLPGPQRVTQLEATLGEALGGGAGGGGGSQLAAYVTPGIGEATEAGPGTEGEPSPKPPREEERPKHEPKTGTEAEPKADGEKAPAGEREPKAEEEAEAPSTPVLRASSTRRVVTVKLEADQQSIAHRGQKVEVVLPGGAQVKGEVRRLTAVEAAGEGGPGEASETGVEATIAVGGKHRVPALDGAAVSVLFTQRVRKRVLSVPLSALWRSAGNASRWKSPASAGGGGSSSPRASPPTASSRCAARDCGPG